MENDYIKEFFCWFVHKFNKEVYAKMGVELYWTEPFEDLVMVINRRRNVIEIESNCFENEHIEYNLFDIGVLFELSRQKPQ